MDRKPSQPAFPAVHPESVSDDGGGRSAAEIFSSNVRVIRGDTGALSLRAILPAQMAHSRFIEQFPADSRGRWVEIMTELMVTAKDCVGENLPVEFYRKFRQLKEAEETRPVAEKLLFVERLAAALSGAAFVHKNGASISTLRVEFCSSDELESAAPSLPARSENGESQKVQLIHVMAGLKIE